ncbi:16S rRNA (cytidine1402-2'-O)-methyltransferase [Clostridium tetanomorphum]|uniref:16S rRNA (cytidine(1402)-2'-O)-methyltransferase n=1 Tax=Clostridium tetanomorphum TaxID=1553 RepID=UPI000448BB9C|nr:16S rRNA (cytidine(1402)-2'-O)-methyltransferase [Clostridium tetanomorphum]KAJ49952.1 uroporphyrin-III C/tetrapyrrole methyltransferase [Clostridium tetanomorphum DSM 665]MBP1866081.1 16S rRNA (cytidine1402-2'-O)-methyltransferase [Clostridium tetanomorphum]NRS86709.1 16S rRNA (cytidine1402-2'-O)-methyltransferase [Clostridium tetanomorphum]SQC00501.1 uroporphyrin-III C/tetrapyrrole methyltransferase [Clostridium tetanomorphum]
MSSGKLFIVPTPIGNLKDITLRALEVLDSVDIIAAEDTRQTIKLTNHYNIKKTLISYHQHNEQGKSNSLIKLLKEGRNIALVSDAGTPGISDPGSVIIQRCIEEGMNFEVLPGATASITALVYSGMDTTKFLFRGFLPRENKDRKIVIEEIKDRKETLIFYESPHRLVNTLEFLEENVGNRRISICRELTKIHEEILRFTLKEAIEYYKINNTKGEYVLILEGKSEEDIEKEEISKWQELSIEQHILKYINEGSSKKEAIKRVAKDRKLSKSEVYKYSLDI